MNLLSIGSLLMENWALLLLLVIIIGFFVLTYLKQRRELNTRNELVTSINKGTKVVTTAGVYGVVESIEETTDGKIIVISTGNAKNPSTMTVHINAIMGIDNKTIVKEAKAKNEKIEEKVDTEKSEEDKATTSKKKN